MLTNKQLEELRYDVAHSLLSKMSKGSQFQYALDRMLDSIADYSEQQLIDIAPQVVVKQTKPRDNRKAKGF